MATVLREGGSSGLVAKALKGKGEKGVKGEKGSKWQKRFGRMK